ncbi:MAG TPA: ATP-binding protein [Bacillota bacterium]|nr:ATP-binding protein [Bacillota bacterium]
MLIMFRAKNFTSFHDEVTLDMRATSDKEHPSHIIPFRDFRLLKTVAIYGANASGKSNLISALFYFQAYIYSHLFQELHEDAQLNGFIKSGIPTLIKPFLLAERVDRRIEFEMVFEQNEVLYQYGFSLEDSTIITEWLYINNELVFDRKENSAIEYGEQYKELLKDYKKYREDRLYLSVLDYFATDNIKSLINNFKSFFAVRFKINAELIWELTIKGAGILPPSEQLIKNEEFRKRVVNYLKTIDVGISDLIVEKKEQINWSGEKKEVSTIKTVHKVYDPNGINGTKTFDLQQESSGTLRFLSYIQTILGLLEKGGVFIVDELSAELHPLLTKFIVDIFQSENSNAQLIFTTHDTSLLNKEQFRQDEVLFVDKNEKGESTIYSLADLKNVSQNAAYNKDYFNGKYGAIPIIQTTEIMNGGE